MLRTLENVHKGHSPLKGPVVFLSLCFAHVWLRLGWSLVSSQAAKGRSQTLGVSFEVPFLGPSTEIQTETIIGVLFGCFAQKNTRPWFPWWLNHLPGPLFVPKRTPMETIHVGVSFRTLRAIDLRPSPCHRA